MSKKQRNVVWLFVLAFLVAESLLILVGSMSFQAKRNHLLEDRTVQLKTAYEAIFNTYSLVSCVIYEQIINTPQITELYSRAYKNNEKRQAEIRDRLFHILNPKYIELSSHSIKQLHFHLPDNVSFLRFHRPEKFGDNLTDIRESNAIKFTHKEGLIKIYEGKPISKEGGNFTEIIIEDNGVGIAKKDLDKLFKIDSGFSNPGTENEKGTGLGLVLVKEFVEKHDGTITIESERGIGTKIIFTLPILA